MVVSQVGSETTRIKLEIPEFPPDWMLFVFVAQVGHRCDTR